MISLDALPQDILFNIFSQLLCPLVSFDIARAPQNLAELLDTDGYRLSKLSGGTYVSGHPFLCLAAQSRSLRFAVEDYCQHLMQKRMTIKQARILKPTWTDWSQGVATAAAEKKKKVVDAKDLRCYRLQYLKWSVESCLFCGKPSKRRAIFNMHMWCCRKCDDHEFGKKLSKTEANKQYKIQELHSTYPQILWPSSWSSGLDFSFANLPVYQGAKLYKEADIARLSQDLKSNPPTRERMTQLKRDVAIREEFQRKWLWKTLADREVITILGKTFDKFLKGDLELPASESARQWLDDDAKRCVRILIASMVHRDAWAAWMRYLRWWDHIIPPALEEQFRRKVTQQDPLGWAKYELLVRSQPESDADSEDREEQEWRSFSMGFDTTAGSHDRNPVPVVQLGQRPSSEVRQVVMYVDLSD